MSATRMPRAQGGGAATDPEIGEVGPPEEKERDEGTERPSEEGRSGRDEDEAAAPETAADTD